MSSSVLTILSAITRLAEHPHAFVQEEKTVQALLDPCVDLMELRTSTSV